MLVPFYVSKRLTEIITSDASLAMHRAAFLRKAGGEYFWGVLAIGARLRCIEVSGGILVLLAIAACFRDKRSWGVLLEAYWSQLHAFLSSIKNPGALVESIWPPLRFYVHAEENVKVYEVTILSIIRCFSTNRREWESKPTSGG